MAFFKVKVQRECNTTRTFNVVGTRPQEALQAAALQLRDEGVADAVAITVVGQINSLRDQKMSKKQQHRDVFVINPITEQTTQIIRLESDAPIDAYDALNAAAKHVEEVALGQPRQLKVYC